MHDKIVRILKYLKGVDINLWLCFWNMFSIFYELNLWLVLWWLKGDQASIVGGAINYLKELEHQLQSMEPQVKTTATKETGSTVGDKNNTITASSSGPFSDFFAFPQYSSRPSSSSVAEGTAEIEVTMVESHASVKILAKKRPKQLLKLVASIQSLRLTLLHLNVTTHDDSVLYSISLKVFFLTSWIFVLFLFSIYLASWRN